MALRRYDLIATLVGDPDVSVRLEVAWQLLGPDHLPAAAALHADRDEQVRAAAYVARLLRGEMLERPADVPRAAAAAAVQAGARVEDLRATAGTAPDPRHRLAAALALALLGDPLAHEVAARDPAPAVRAAVAAALARHGTEGAAGADGAAP
jgi:HEAT repeat protein